MNENGSNALKFMEYSKNNLRGKLMLVNDYNQKKKISNEQSIPQRAKRTN